MKTIYCFIFVFIFTTNIIFAQWYPHNSGTDNNFSIVQFVTDSIGWTSATGKLYKTTDGGNNWFLQTDFLPEYVVSIFFLNENVGWLLTYYSLNQETRIYKTVNGGDNWLLKKLETDSFLGDIKFVNDTVGWCVGSGGLYPLPWVPVALKTIDGGESWESISVSPTYFIDFTCVDFINELEGWIGGWGCLFKTSDGGANWTEIPYLDGSTTLLKMQFMNSDIGWSTTDYNGFFKTTSGGNSWIQQSVQASDFYFVDEQRGWSTNLNSIDYTTNSGNIWTPQNSNTTKYLRDISFIDSNTGWIVGDSGTILYTPNGGIPVEIMSFTADIVDSYTLLRWITATETNNKGFEIQRSPDGNTWDAIGFVQGGGTTTEIHNYSFIDYNVKDGIYSYRLKQIDFDGTFEYSDKIEINFQIPKIFILEQNYPNPFNPITTIKYSIGDVGTSPASPSGGFMKFVKLKVFDILGNEVATLVNEAQPAGNYTIRFDGSKLASGIYLYQLKSENFTQTYKMILLK